GAFHCGDRVHTADQERSLFTAEARSARIALRAFYEKARSVKAQRGGPSRPWSAYICVPRNHSSIRTHQGRHPAPVQAGVRTSSDAANSATICRIRTRNAVVRTRFRANALLLQRDQPGSQPMLRVASAPSQDRTLRPSPTVGAAARSAFG